MDEAEYSPSGGDNEEEDNEDKLESYDNGDDDDDKLDRRFHQAKAEAAAAAEALADPSPSTGHSTDIYGHSQQYYHHQENYVAFLQELLSGTKQFPSFPKHSDGTVIVDTHPDYAPPRIDEVIGDNKCRGTHGNYASYYNAAQSLTRLEKNRASPLNRCCNHSYGSTPGTHFVSLITPMTYFPPRSHSGMST